MVLVFQNNYRKYKHKDSLRLSILNSHAGHQPSTECSKKQPRYQKKNIEEHRSATLALPPHAEGKTAPCSGRLEVKTNPFFELDIIGKAQHNFPYSLINSWHSALNNSVKLTASLVNGAY